MLHARSLTSYKDVFYFIKKRFVPLAIVAALCFSSIPISTQAENDFQFSYPTGGSSLVMGNSYSISWTKNPSAGISHIRLSLIDTNEIVSGTIAILNVDPLAATGSYLWAIPSETSPEMVISSGASYRIKAVVESQSSSAVHTSGLITINVNPSNAPDMAVTAIQLGSWHPSLGFSEVLLRQDWVNGIRFGVKNIGGSTATTSSMHVLVSINGVNATSICENVISGGFSLFVANQAETFSCPLAGQLPLGPVNASVSITTVPNEISVSNNTLVKPFTILSTVTASNVTITNSGTVASNVIFKPNQTDIKLAEFKVKANGSENIRADKIVFYSEEKPIKLLKNLTLVRGGQSWSAQLVPQTWYGTHIVFSDINQTISAGQEATYTLKGDLTPEAQLGFESNLSLVRYGTSKFIGLNSGQEVDIQGQEVKTHFSILTKASEPAVIDHIKKEKEQVKNVDQNLVTRSRGKIYVQVESRGEAWYVSPKDGKKYYMANGASAYDVLRKFGVGATTVDLRKIQVGESKYKLVDNDRDGLDDKTEEALGLNPNKGDSDNDGYLDGTEVYNGYNPQGAGKSPIDKRFTDQMKGKIFLQVEGRGEAWYINPNDGKRYFLADAETAYEIMRRLSTGITNENLRKISVGDL